MFWMLAVLIGYQRPQAMQLQIQVRCGWNKKTIPHLHDPPRVFIAIIALLIFRHRNTRLYWEIRISHCHLQFQSVDKTT